MKKLFALVYIALPLVLFCVENKASKKASQEEGEPLYTGSLLAIYARNEPPGYLSVQPYLLATTNYGEYNNNSSLERKKHSYDIDLLNFFETGITDTLDITLFLDQRYCHFQGKNAVRNGDTDVRLGYQALINKRDTWIPDMRFLIGERFPTGKYKNLNPDLGGTDGVGNGAFQTAFIFVTRKIFYIPPTYPFNISLNVLYILSSRAKVSGFNTYGGGYGTKGNVYPGNQLIINLAYELSITKYWEFIIDIRYHYQGNTTFSGERGLTEQGTAAQVGHPPSYLISLAPGVGYNFSKVFSLDFGVWFSVAGRNEEACVTGVGTVYYAF